MFKWIKDAWDAVKAWFKYSWSIFLARAEMVTGVVIAAVSSVDFSSLISGIQSGLTWGQGTVIGGLLVLKGIVSELGRRQGTVELSDGQMIPANISEKKEAIEIIKEEKK